MGVIKAPVTALGFAGNFVIAGVGGYVRVYDKSSYKVVLEEKILEHNVIHGFEFHSAVGNRFAVVYGGMELCLCKLNLDTNHASIEILLRKKVCDWIWDAIFVFRGKPNVCDIPELVSLALGHNSVILFDWKKGITLTESHCEEKCILYSAHFIREEKLTWDLLTLCSGTVFNQVVIWKPGSITNTSSVAKVITRIQAHDGVIFSMCFDTKSGFLVTASDDRSIRLWTCEFPSFDSKQSNIGHFQGSYENLCKLYGHDSRVWRARCIHQHDKLYLVSVGEDGYCIFWELETQSDKKLVDGRIIKKIRCHKGKNIWSLAIDPINGYIATGGGDTGIRLFNINDAANSNPVITSHPFNAVNCTISKREDRDIGVLKSIHMCSEKVILGHTDSGVLLRFDIQKPLWTVIDANDNFKSYAILRVCDKINAIAIANTAGEVLLLQTDNSWNEVISKVQFAASLLPGKIHNMTWFACDGAPNLFISGPEGEFTCYKYTGTGKLLCSWIIPPSKHRWHMGAILMSIDEVLYAVCGDRRGSLHLFKQGVKDPLHTLHGVHGKNGVTSLQYFNGTIISTGRDGNWRKVGAELHGGIMKIISGNRAAQGMDWLASAIADNRYTNSLVILGFHGRNFMAWSHSTSDLLMSVECGGGHRDWSFLVENSKSYLAFIKESTLNIATVSQDITNQTSVVEPHFHGGQITCLKLVDSYFDLFSSKYVSFIATGSEDTKIFISVILHCYQNKEETKLHHVHLIDDHISNVRAVDAIKVESSDKGSTTMLFTGGGRATVNSYLVRITYGKGWSESCTIERFSSHTLNAKTERRKSKQPLSTNPETRYMDLSSWRNEGTVMTAAACSDGVVRVFKSDSSDRSMQLIVESTSYAHCFLTIRHSELNGRDCLVTGATDGMVRIFAADNLRSYPSDSSSIAEIINIPRHCFVAHVHMSGINALDVVQFHALHDQKQKNSAVIVTGGDDNSIQIVALSHERDMCDIVDKFSIPNAHSSQLTGLRLNVIEESKCIELISTSIDQRITKWNISFWQNEIKCQFVSSILTNIADISCLEVWKSKLKNSHDFHSDFSSYVVCGQGIQILYSEF